MPAELLAGAVAVTPYALAKLPDFSEQVVATQLEQIIVHMVHPDHRERGTSSSVVASRPGSANPRTHFSDAFVLYLAA